MAENEVEESESKFAEQLRKAANKLERINFNVLRETTQSISAAMQTYADKVKTQTKAIDDAELAYRQTRLDSERLRRSYGQFGNSILATIKTQKANIAVAQAQYNLAQAATTQAKALLDANQEAIVAQNEKIANLRAELAPIKDAIKQKQAERSAITESINSKKDEIAYTKSQIAKAKEEQAIIDARKSAIREANKGLQAEADSSRDLEKFMKSQIAAANEEISASKDKVDALRENENVQKSQIDVINEDIRRLQKRGEFKGRGKQAEITKAEEEQIRALQERKESILAAFNATKDARKAEIAYQQSIAENIPGMETEMQAAVDAATAYESAISKNNEIIAKDGMARLKLSEQITKMSSDVDKLNQEQKDLEKQYNDYTSSISDLTQKGGKLSVKLKQAVDSQTQLTQAQKDLAKAHEDLAAEEEAQRQELINTKLKALSEVMISIAGKAKGVADALQKVIGPILELQKQFGISAGSAAKLKFENLMTAASSYATSLMTGAPAVSTKEIEDTQGAFQAEFGGVLTSDAARGLAEEAKRLGVGASELAKARRVFMTQTMGDADKAQAQTDKFVAEFAKKGLTASDAMKAIGQNSELLARNGTRFATSFARAAADAKKIGVDLSKVDQIGDSIIGDFEGFLEKTSELGAMGFNLDTTRLAEIAESGDTGQLFNELRSQLASTGKDITKLRRSEQLALSQTFGMSIEEFQRMAAPPGTEGSGKQTLSPEDLQREANKSLGDLVFRTDAMIGILGTAVTILGVIASNTAMGALKSLLGGSMPGLSGGISSGVGGALTSNAVKIGGSVLAGGVGAFMGFKTAKEKGKDNYEAAGAGTVQGASAAAGAYGGSAVGAAIGTAILPGIGTAIGAVIGPAVGGFLGNTFGKAINTYFPSVAANLGGLFKGFTSAFEPVKTAFSGLKDAFKPLTTAFGKLFDVFKPAGDAAGKASPIFEVIGSVIGTLVAGPLTFLIDVLKIGIQLITIAVDGWRMLFQALKDVYTYLSDKFTQIGTVIKDAWNGIIDWIASKIPDWMKKGASAVSNAASSVMAAPGKAWEGIKGFFNNAVETTAGDDVVSKPGYGERSLVTPTGVIALNNKDNIVAYADDLVGTTKLPYGAITKNVAELGLDTGPLIASLFEKGTSVFGGKGAGALSHLGKMLTGNAGMAKYDFIPRTIQTMFGTTGKFAPAAMKFLAQNAKAIPIIGSLIGGGLTGYSEFKESGSIGRAIAKGLFSAGGGMLGSVGAGALTAGNPIAASVGGLAGSKGGEALFDTLFGNGKMKSSAASSKLPVRKADDFISTGGSTGGTNLPLGTISKLKEPSVQIPNISTLMGPPQTTTTTAPTVVEKTVKIDTSGIEQKLNGFIAALQGMQINLDGVRVGNALVNSTNTSTKLGVMTTQARTGI